MEIMCFLDSFDNMFLFSNHNVTHMNVSKQYNENRGVRALLTIRKHQINLPPSSNFLPKWFRSLVQYRSLNSWGTVNLYCDTAIIDLLGESRIITIIRII